MEEQMSEYPTPGQPASDGMRAYNALAGLLDTSGVMPEDLTDAIRRIALWMKFWPHHSGPDNLMHWADYEDALLARSQATEET